MTGFDASGHIAEETKHARYDAKYFVLHEKADLSHRVVAARGIFGSAVATGICGFTTAILFLFCTPDIDILFSLNAPQPFVQIYALALGRGGSVFMTIIAAIGLIMVRKLNMTCITDPAIDIPLPKKTEHIHRNRCRLPSRLRSRPRWCPSLLRLDQPSHSERLAPQRRYRHVHLRRDDPLYDLTLSSSLHVSRLCRRRPDDCGVWVDRSTETHDDTQSVQVVVLQSGKASEAVLCLRSCVQRDCVLGYDFAVCVSGYG